MIWNRDWLWSQFSGLRIHLDLIWGILSYFTFLRWYQCPSRLVPVFLGNLWISIKEINTPTCLIRNTELHCKQWSGIGIDFELIWRTASSFPSWGFNCILLDFWQCSCGLSGFPSSQSRLLTSLIGNKKVVCKKCRGIGLVSRQRGRHMIFLELHR